MKHLYRALLKLMTAGIPVVIAACYGPPVEYPAFTKNGKVLDFDSHQGINNIRVSCVLDDGTLESETYSGQDGAFTLAYDNTCAKVTAVDTDGAENGGTYGNSEVAFSAESSEITIMMKKQ